MFLGFRVRLVSGSSYVSCKTVILIIVRLAMSPKRGWRDVWAQIKLGADISTAGV